MPNALASLSSASSALAGPAPKSDAKGAPDAPQENFDKMAQDAADAEPPADRPLKKTDKTATSKAVTDGDNMDGTGGGEKDEVAADGAVTPALPAPQPQPQPQTQPEIAAAALPVPLAGTQAPEASQDPGESAKSDGDEIEAADETGAPKGRPGPRPPETLEVSLDLDESALADGDMIAADGDPEAPKARPELMPPVDSASSRDQDISDQDISSAISVAPASAFTATFAAPAPAPSTSKASETAAEGTPRAATEIGDIAPDPAKDQGAAVPEMRASYPSASSETETAEVAPAAPGKPVRPQGEQSAKPAAGAETPHGAKKTAAAETPQPSAAPEPSPSKPASAPSSNETPAPSFTAPVDKETLPALATRMDATALPPSATAPMTAAQARPLPAISMISVRAQTHEGQIHLPTEQISIAITRQSRQGNNRFEIRLDPPELGRIDVRLEVGSDGRATASLTADRQDTLDLLTRDSRTLQKTLSDAGFNTDGDALRFSLRDEGNSQRGGRFGADKPQIGKEASSPEDIAPLPAMTQLTASLGPGRLDLRV